MLSVKIWFCLNIKRKIKDTTEEKEEIIVMMISLERNSFQLFQEG